jgi:hypothetical protein
MLMNVQALLLRLFIGHFVADFVLQSRSMIIEKGAKAWKSGALYIHAGIYTALVFVAASAWKRVLWLVPALFVSHFLIDGWKASRRNKTLAFVADQAAHLAVLTVIFIALAGSAADPLSRFLWRAWHSPRVLVIVLGYLVVLWPVGRLMNVITDRFRQQLDDKKSRGLELAGLWIGCLERLFLLTFLLFDNLPGIALLVGLKSLFRFGEIKDPRNRKETEYILIGTLLSFSFASAVGIAVKALMKTLP